MKTLLILSIFIGFYTKGYTQTINGTIIHDGIIRTYKLYIPSIYNGNTAVPLLFNFHGYTSNSNEQMFYGDFRNIADTANFLMVFPNGTYSSGQRFWNAGLSSALVNDIAFLSALIDSLDLTYNINLNRKERNK